MQHQTVKILAETHAALSELKETEGRSHVEIMRRAVAAYKDRGTGPGLDWREASDASGDGLYVVIFMDEDVESWGLMGRSHGEWIEDADPWLTLGPIPAYDGPPRS